MVEGFLKEEKLNKTSEINVNPNDIITVEIDQDLFDLDEAQQYMKIVGPLFKHNPVLATFKGIEFGVIHMSDTLKGKGLHNDSDNEYFKSLLHDR